jgi:hypothetical protein
LSVPTESILSNSLFSLSINSTERPRFPFNRRPLHRRTNLPQDARRETPDGANIDANPTNSLHFRNSPPSRHAPL